MIRLYIDNKLASLPADGLDVSINFAIYDNNALSNIKGATTTRTAKLPADKNNQSIFNQYGGVSNGVIPAQFELACRIELAGLPILTGIAYLQQVEFKAGVYQLEPEFYEVLIIGENADFFTRLRGKYLREVISEPPHTQTPALMEAGLEADYDLGDKYGYCPIQYLPFQNGNEITVGELTPFYFQRALLDDICASVGYALKSDFFNTAPFKRLILPLYPVSIYPPEFAQAYLNVKANVLATVPYPNFEVINFPFNNILTPPTVGANPYNTATYYYTVPVAGFYKVDALFEFAWDGVNNNSAVSAFLSQNGTPPTPPMGAVRSTNAVQTGETLRVSYVFQCAAGDTLSAGIIGVVLGTPPDGLSVTRAELGITGQAQYIYPQTDNFINLAYLTRDWTVIDFLKGLTAAFNLVWQADAVTGEITCEPKDDYTLYLPETATQTQGQGFYFRTIENFTQRIDLSQPATLTNEIGKAINTIVNFKDDPNDFYISLLNETVEAGAKVGGAWFLPSNLKAEKDVRVDENPFFAATTHRLAAEITQIAPDGSEINPQIPILFTEGNSFSSYNFEYQPRLLYFRPFGSTIQDGYFNLNNGTTITTRKYQPCFAVNGNDTTGLDWVLHYNGETIADNNTRGLAYTYYLREYNRQILGNTLKCFARYNASQINKLTFRQKIQIAQGVFILLNISNYQPNTNDPTQITAIQDTFAVLDFFQNNQPSGLNVATVL